MKIKYIPEIAVAASLAAFTFSASAEPMVEDAPKTEEAAAAAEDGVEAGSLTNLIKDSTTFSILTKALKAAELDTVLGQKGSFTIFAPTDEAFMKLPTGTLDKLMLPENKEKLRSLLMYHVVSGSVMVKDMRDMDTKTMNGEKIEVDYDKDGKEIEINEVHVASPDVTANNGVMHSIGEVLVPESLDNFAGLKD